MVEKAPPKSTDTLYDAVIALAIEHECSGADLHLPDTPQTRRLISRFPERKRSANFFRHPVKKTRWFDIPLANLPWWRAKSTCPKSA